VKFAGYLPGYLLYTVGRAGQSLLEIGMDVHSPDSRLIISYPEVQVRLLTPGSSASHVTPTEVRTKEPTSRSSDG
jgi:hypothetical protein